MVTKLIVDVDSPTTPNFDDATEAVPRVRGGKVPDVSHIKAELLKARDMAIISGLHAILMTILYHS